MSRSIVAFFLLFCWGNVSAQSDKVLIIAPDGGGKVQHLKAIIEAHYDGVVAVMPSLPPVLSFDAIFTGTRSWSEEMLFDSVAQVRLVEYLMNGGRFYAEGGAFRSREEGATNILWDFLGDSLEVYTATVVDLTRIRGVDSEFTKGLDYSDEPYENNFNGDAGGGFHIEQMRPLLWGEGSYSLPLAWAPLDRNIKAVLSWPIGNPQYDEFLARVLCVDFGLCMLEVKEKEAQPRLAYDPVSRTLILPSGGQIVLSDIIGHSILDEHIKSDRFTIPEQLTAGTYIAIWINGEQRASITISIR